MAFASIFVFVSGNLVSKSGGRRSFCLSSPHSGRIWVLPTESTVSCKTSSLILSYLPEAVEIGLIWPSSRKQRADCRSKIRLPSQAQSWPKAEVSVKVRGVNSIGEFMRRVLSDVTILVHAVNGMIPHRWKRVIKPRRISHHGGN